ncbi:hypothetical protein LPJ56_001353 [Coemansia sp. RSA 2599]|nr:hypothetical protein LPJ56_001353 [Coemansia sp. RSA 2599]
MSYIPRPAGSATAAATATAREERSQLGRADENPPTTSSHSSSAFGILSQTIKSPRQGPVQLPSSTRASVVKVMTESSAVPELPPIPGLDIDTASFVSTTRLSHPASMHRRAVSAGNEASKEPTPKDPAYDELGNAHTVDLAATYAPRTKSRLSLSGFRFGRAQSKSKKHHQQTNEESSFDVPIPLSSAKGARWTAQEVNALAESSLRFWKSGTHVDLAALAVDLGRSPKEVRDMLEYVLLGYARFGGTPSWADQSQKFIMEWAALEFPRNPQLNPGAASSRSRHVGSVLRLEACFSAFKCMPRMPPSTPTFAIDGKSGAHSSQNIVADFREGMRLQNVEPQSVGAGAEIQQRPSALGLSSPSSSPSLSSATTDALAASARRSRSRSGNTARVEISERPQSHTIDSAKDSTGDNAIASGNISSSSNSSNSSVQKPGSAPSSKPTAPAANRAPAREDAATGSKPSTPASMENAAKAGSSSSIPIFGASASSHPVFTGGLRSRQTVTTLNRPTRSRRARRNSYRHETGSFGFRMDLDAAAEKVDAPLAREKPKAYQSEEKAQADVEHVYADARNGAESYGNGAGPAIESALASGRPRANTVSHMQSTTASATAEEEGAQQETHRLSRDSGNIDEPAPQTAAADMLGDIELSPDQSQHVIGVNQTDADIDARFADLPAETRRKVRHFVSKFIKDYSADFQQRVEAQVAGRDGLCITVDHFADFEYNNDAFLKAIETIYRYVGGSVMYTCNMFFHVQLLHAIRLDRIPVTDESWLRVNEFATCVFNKRIEDARYIVFQEYTSQSEEDAAEGAGNAPGGAWHPAARNGRLDSFTGSEGNEHNSPFERAYYMDKLARRYVAFLLDVKGEEFTQRVREHGPRPMPVALRVDEKTMLPLDIEIRNMLIAFIWEDIPQSTLESKEITLLRALELLNSEFADRCGFNSRGLQLALDGTRNVDAAAASDPEVAGVADLQDHPGMHQAQILGRAFARSYFHEAKYRFLEAMLHDHPFRPVTREELKEWSVRGSGPFGEDVDYRLNTRLYRYLRRMQMRPSSKQWLQASASATLSMLRRTMEAALHKDYLAHIDIAAYEMRFKEIVVDARGSSSSTMSSIGFSQSANASRLRLSAFGRRPALQTPAGTSSRPVGSAAVRHSASRPVIAPSSLSAQRSSATNGTAGSQADALQESRSKTQPQPQLQPRSSTAPPYRQIQAASSHSSRAADHGADNSSPSGAKASAAEGLGAPPPSSVHGPAAGVHMSVPSGMSPVMASHQLLTSAYAAPAQTAHVATPSPALQYSVPVPVSAAGYHMAQPMPMPHAYAPYVDQHQQFQQLPVMYSPGAPGTVVGGALYPPGSVAMAAQQPMVAGAPHAYDPYELSKLAASSGSRVDNGANMTVVLQKFEEMQQMIRQLQMQRGQ